MTSARAAVLLSVKEGRSEQGGGWQSGLWEEGRSVALISLLSSPSARCSARRSRKLTKAKARGATFKTRHGASQGIIDSSPLTRRRRTNIPSRRARARTHTPTKSITFDPVRCTNAVRPPPHPAGINRTWDIRSEAFHQKLGVVFSSFSTVSGTQDPKPIRSSLLLPFPWCRCMSCRRLSSVSMHSSLQIIKACKCN